MFTRIVIICFITCLLYCPLISADEKEKPSEQNDVVVKNQEVIKLRNEFEKIGISISLEKEYFDQIYLQINYDIKQYQKNFSDSQFFVYVDRNPDKQMVFICFFEKETSVVSIIGYDKTSTGNPKRKGHFITPIGIFENSPKHLSYRAEGTKNSKGWRGLGSRGSRVWDFGWQETEHKNSKTKIRLLMHATDPDFGEPRLGKVDSKGCIRISGKMNKFINYYGLLDQEYEKTTNRPAIKWILKKDRNPPVHIGKYIVVGDSTKL